MKFERIADPRETALFIRGFEMALFDLHKQGLISGTIHTCIGQEMIPVALHRHLQPGIDGFFATHRGHGHFLAHGGEPEALLAEIMGRAGGVCNGRGGSQHLCHKRFFSNGIQGAGSLQAVGFAWMQKLLGNGAVTVAQLGDGTLGEGAVYEAMNFAALLKVPVLFLIEYNGWAQSTDVLNTISGTIEGRAAAFGLPCDRCDDLDIEALTTHFGQVIERVRAGQPWVQIVETRRLMAHSKGDDNRPAELISSLYAADPLTVWEKAQPHKAEALQFRVDARLSACITEVSARPLLTNLDGSALPVLTNLPSSKALCAALLDGRPGYGTIVEELNRALHTLLAEDERVVVIGEDIADPYGGAFKVTKGLSTDYGLRVFSTPIAENAIVGLAAGAALGGLRPVAEVMFADFVTLAADQLINSAAKFHYMFGGKVICPITIRLVSGGRRGYGPTHSQSTERLFCGEPGLRVVALSQRHDPGALLSQVIRHDDAPTIFVEDKALYGRKPLIEPPLGMHFNPISATQESYPPLVFAPDEIPSVTVVSYGASSELGEKALEKLLLEHEIYGDLIVLTQLWPLEPTAIIDSVSRSRHLLVIEPHVVTYGVGAAIARAAAETLDASFRLRTVGARPYPIPSARALEDQVLPTLSDVESALYQLLRIS
jgi:2-oxoisovalerate dehydrogenase E1 component